MARIRSIHPNACQSKKLDAASAAAERCYWRLLPHCDDEGRVEDDPTILRSEMFKAREHLPSSEVDGWLTELHELGLLVRYEVDGVRYLQVSRWTDYQKPQKKVESKLPGPPDRSAAQPKRSRTSRVVLPEDGGSGLVGTCPGEGEGVGGGEGVTPLSLVPNDVGDPIKEVFTAWQESTGKSRAKLDPKRRRVIERGLELYPIEDLIDAVRGWKHSKHHRGDNDRQTVYNDLDVCLRDAKHIEEFRDLERREGQRVNPRVGGLPMMDAR